jgi:eukaryotic-like serine/threonine-protein kinase
MMQQIRPNLIVARRYRLARKLADGGMGSVWAAHDHTLGCEVALKFIHPSHAAYSDALARFAAEARAAAVLAAETDYVVRIFDFGVDDGIPFIAMELLRGEDLGARLARCGRLAPADVAHIVGQIARALSRAHARGIDHRDLKPENVFLACRDEEERVKLLDFGVAKHLGPSGAPASAQPVGTLHYVAPEALGSRRIDCRADLWSLGVMIYRAIVGALPFDAETVEELVQRICGDRIPQPSRCVRGLPAELDVFFARALCRDPGQRFQHADELSRAFSDAARLSWRPPPSIAPPELASTIPVAPGLRLDGPHGAPITQRSPVASW